MRCLSYHLRAVMQVSYLQRMEAWTFSKIPGVSQTSIGATDNRVLRAVKTSDSIYPKRSNKSMMGPAIEEANALGNLGFFGLLAKCASKWLRTLRL
ncbi:hypothetical protein NPIL_341481 [Nephila pilipes]|uniref:Uncharacterized protein n=1 Tax=Nephila pilipes TaxID=299642 RepID=A0A8X6MWT4_NEPPI|nr:hypothetical protein NPIL_341481 [Nephila pilipes]